MTMANGNVVTFRNAAQYILPLKARRVHAIGTTATATCASISKFGAIMQRPDPMMLASSLDIRSYRRRALLKGKAGAIAELNAA